MIFWSDFNSLKNWNMDVFVSSCSKCNDFGHKDAECEKEINFSNVPTAPGNL